MWSQTVGLINGQYKYLTAETFGFKINANGSALKKKQLWSIEAYPLSDEDAPAVNDSSDLLDQEHVAIKSHLNCYLAVDAYGNVTCESSDLHSGARFTITICSMTTSGEGEQIFWAFRNVDRGYFLGCTSDGMINCAAKVPQSRGELWHIHLVPARGASMFALKSAGRKRFARFVQPIDGPNDEMMHKLTEQVQVDSTDAWGSDTLFQFKYYEGGKYALLTSNCKYITCEGTCVNWSPVSPSANGSNGIIVKTNQVPPVESLFSIEYHGGSIAFRDHNGRYLAAVGRSAVLRTRSNTVSRDELFTFEPAPLQVALRADFNCRFVSIKQGIDVSANQSDISSKHETFQLEYFEESDTWAVKSHEGKYWSPGAASAIQVSERQVSAASHFKVLWSEDGTCTLAASNSSGQFDEHTAKWVCARKSGQLCFSSTDPVGFHMMLMNRRTLNLRPLNGTGFLGLKSPGSGKIECNKITPDSLIVEYANNESANGEQECELFNCCYLRMPAASNKYISLLDANAIIADSTSKNCAQQFILEVRSGSGIAIRLYENVSYLNLNKQGSLTIAPCHPADATLWEF